MLPTPNQQPRPQPANPRQTVRISPLLPTPNQQPPRQQTSTLTPHEKKHDFEINVTLQLMASLSKCCNANAENLINTLIKEAVKVDH